MQAVGCCMQLVVTANVNNEAEIDFGKNLPGLFFESIFYIPSSLQTHWAHTPFLGGNADTALLQVYRALSSKDSKQH